MYSIDERLRGLPALKEQVVQLHQSLNTPHVAIPGRQAGPATAFVLGLRGPSGFAVFVYLYILESGECAVYVPSSGAVPAEQFQGAESEALAFVESLGFMMDNLNFRGRAADEQEAMVRTLPVFMREPPPPEMGSNVAPQVGRGNTGPQLSASVLVGKLFASFCVLLLAACTHASAREKEQSRLHSALAVQNLLNEPQAALRDADEAIVYDAENAEAWHVKALVLHHSFQRLEEAKQAYEKALALAPKLSEARTNLGNLYMDLRRYDEAIEQYRQALDDVRYPTPYIPQGNMGWALYKKGNSAQAIEALKGALAVNPKYCVAQWWLGQVYESQNNDAESCKYYARFREHCPERADAWQHDGLCLANRGETEAAKKAFEMCVQKAQRDEQRELCLSLKERLHP